MIADRTTRRLLDIAAVCLAFAAGSYLGMPYLAVAFTAGWVWRDFVR